MGLKAKSMATGGSSGGSASSNASNSATSNGKSSLRHCTNRVLNSAKRFHHKINTNNCNNNNNNNNTVNVNNSNNIMNNGKQHQPSGAMKSIVRSFPICLGKRTQTIVKTEMATRRSCTSSSSSSSSSLTNSSTKVTIINNKKNKNNCDNHNDDNDDVDVDNDNDKMMKTTTTTTTTIRSTSTSALYNCVTLNVRPRTLNVHHNQHNTPTDHTQSFLGEVLNAWRAKARCNVLPAERAQELFQELSFHPNDKQISEMLQTAKLLACKGRCNTNQVNGLTFGEFCVFAADLKRFRTSNLANAAPIMNDAVNMHEQYINKGQNLGHELRTTKSLNNVDDCKNMERSTGSPVEVFLGGSCNPTTWRADVAIPALKELGITFYNPQVSDWTPDLIELEHRAKEKARVLFFVMDSETRASAGAIEAAHIAGQNCKQLVLVLHPYKPNQSILNERISEQEYLDLTRNQLILRELVTRRGLPVLDNIPDGLQRTKEILHGFRDPPPNISSILIVVRGAFDRVNPVHDRITIEKCQRALQYLGYVESLIDLKNLKKIVNAQRESLRSLECDDSTKRSKAQQIPLNSSTSSTSASSSSLYSSNDLIDFNLFCVVFAYLSVLQQEMHESGCISPIKGTNVPPPPVYLTNMQGEGGYTSNHHQHFNSKNVSRNSSNASIICGKTTIMGGHYNDSNGHGLNDFLSRSGDSGTSSPLPMEQPTTIKYRARIQIVKKLTNKPSIKQHYHHSLQPLEGEDDNKVKLISNLKTRKRITKTSLKNNIEKGEEEEEATTSDGNDETEVDFGGESDSNDSVFSSSNSSLNSINCCSNEYMAMSTREVYLGGSCYLRTKWRQDIAIPYLKEQNITYHLPTLHESLYLVQQTKQKKAETVTEADDVKGKDEKDNGQDQLLKNLLIQTKNNIRHTSRMHRNSRTNIDIEKGNDDEQDEEEEEEEQQFNMMEKIVEWSPLFPVQANLYNPALLDSSRVLLFVITNETRSLAPMTLAAHCIGLMYNVVLAVQMLPDDCIIGNEKLTPTAIKDYNRGRSYLIDLAKRQGVPVFNDIQSALDCVAHKIKSYQSRRYN